MYVWYTYVVLKGEECELLQPALTRWAFARIVYTEKDWARDIIIIIIIIFWIIS